MSEECRIVRAKFRVNKTATSEQIAEKLEKAGIPGYDNLGINLSGVKPIPKPAPKPKPKK